MQSFCSTAVGFFTVIMSVRRTNQLMKIARCGIHLAPINEYQRIATGERVLLPQNSTSCIDPTKVIAYGKDAVVFQDPHSKYEEEREMNKHAYLKLRSHLLEMYEGSWCSIVNQGNAILFSNNEAHLYDQLLSIKNSTDSFLWGAAYTNCMGRECLCEYDMGCEYDMADLTSHDEADVMDNIQINDQSVLNQDGSILCKAQHSFTAKDPFSDIIMKHETGASVVGAPQSVVDATMARNLPMGQECNLVGVGRTTSKVCASQYVNLFGLITKVDLVAYKCWIIGYPLWKRYKNIVDVQAQQPLVMEQHATQKSHL